MGLIGEINDFHFECQPRNQKFSCDWRECKQASSCYLADLRRALTLAAAGAGSVKYSARGATATLERGEEETGEFSCIMVPQNTGHAAIERGRAGRKEGEEPGWSG